MVESLHERGGTLKPGDIFKVPTGDVWFVDSVSTSGAHCIHLSGHHVPLTTRKGATKVIRRHKKIAVFSLRSAVDLIDPKSLDSVQLKRRLLMARKEGTAAVMEPGQEAPTAAAKPEKVRVTQRYQRTDKAPARELRGQAKETFEALTKFGDKAVTAKEVADACAFANSRQDKERVAGFYLSQFKRDGLVVVKLEETSAPPAA